MALTYLQLVNRVKREAGIPGAALASLTSPVEEIARVCQWVNDAYLDLQQDHPDWEFLRKSFTFQTVASQGSYTPAQCNVADLGDWKRDTFRIYLTSNGVTAEAYLPFLDYDTFRNQYLYGSMSTQTANPVVFTIDPAKNIVLGNVPNGIYTVSGSYFRTPYVLALDADVPALPDQWHSAMVWKALQHYGMYEAAPEVVQRATAEYKRIMARLQADQMPQVSYAQPLA